MSNTEMLNLYREVDQAKERIVEELLRETLVKERIKLKGQITGLKQALEIIDTYLG